MWLDITSGGIISAGIGPAHRPARGDGCFRREFAESRCRSDLCASHDWERDGRTEQHSFFAAGARRGYGNGRGSCKSRRGKQPCGRTSVRGRKWSGGFSNAAVAGRCHRPTGSREFHAGRTYRSNAWLASWPAKKTWVRRFSGDCVHRFRCHQFRRHRCGEPSGCRSGQVVPPRQFGSLAGSGGRVHKCFHSVP